MSSFDTTAVNVYLVSVFTIAALALVLALGVVTTAVARNRKVRLSRHQSLRSYYGPLALHH